MREDTQTFRVYTYPELSESAKEAVRAKINQWAWDDGSAIESMEHIWRSTLEDQGWTELNGLTFDLYSQGGYPSWSGVLEGWEHGGHRWTVQTSNGRSYFRYVNVEPEWDADDDADRTPEETEAAELAAKELVDSLAGDIFYKMREEDEYIGSDETVAEACEANGYEFLESGEFYS